MQQSKSSIPVQIDLLAAQCEEDAVGGVFFDVDGTWRRRQLMHDVIQHAAPTNERAQRILAELEPALRAYEERAGTFDAVNALAVKLVYYGDFFPGMSVLEMEEVAERVISERGRHVHFFTRALSCAAHAVGMHRAIISGSPAEVVRAFAFANGIHLFLGTEMEIVDGTYTGKVRKAWVEDKAEAVRALAAANALNLGASVAIGDSGSDIPMLGAVQYPICFNPKDERLLQKARKSRWPIVMEKGETWFAFRPDRSGSLYEVPLDEILPELLADALSHQLSAL